MSSSELVAEGHNGRVISMWNGRIVGRMKRGMVRRKEE